MNKYLLVGIGNDELSIDLLSELANASKAGQFLLLYIKDGINYANRYDPVVEIRSKDLTGYQQKLVIEGYKELHEKGLVRRIKRGFYMINPNALIPPNYEEAIKVWNSAKKAIPKDKTEPLGTQNGTDSSEK